MHYIDLSYHKQNCTRDTSCEVRQCLENLPGDVAVNYAPWFVPFIPGVPSYITNLIPYKFYFPDNVPIFGYPIVVLEPIVVPESPSDLTQLYGNKVDVLITTVAEELQVVPPIVLTDDDSLREVLEPKINSFSNASYDEVIALYSSTTARQFHPDVITPSYLYRSMTTDVFFTCMMNDLVTKISRIPRYKPYRMVTSQQPSGSVNGKHRSLPRMGYVRFIRIY